MELKQLDYEYRAIHLVKDGGQQHSEEYKKANPSAQVPLLIDGDVKVGQSLTIIEYLEEAYKTGTTVLPGDAAKRATIREIADTIGCDVQPVQNLRLLQHLSGLGQDKMEWGKHWIARGFDVIEKLLEKSAGKYCVGDEVTLADVCLVPQIYNAERFSVDMSRYPTISRIGEALGHLEAFKRAHPSAQPDAE